MISRPFGCRGASRIEGAGIIGKQAGVRDWTGWIVDVRGHDDITIFHKPFDESERSEIHALGRNEIRGEKEHATSRGLGSTSLRRRCLILLVLGWELQQPMVSVEQQ